MKRGNTRVRRSRRQSKRDPWEIYDRLPPAIRAVLQEGPTQGSPGHVDHFFRKHRRSLGEAAAITITVEMLSDWHLRDVFEGRDWWPPHPKRGRRYRSPHVRANATMQTSGRPQPA
jgi:Family of unknown function (DUF6525)